MPNRKRNGRAANENRLNPARQRAISKVKRIIQQAKENKKYFEIKEQTSRIYDPLEALEFRDLAKESDAKIAKGKALITKIKKGQRNLTIKSTIRELTPRAKPWVERILKNQTFVHAQLSYHEKKAFEKMGAGKKVTRAEMNQIIASVREYRWIILGEQKFAPRQGKR